MPEMKNYLLALVVIVLFGGGVALAMRLDGAKAANAVVTRDGWRFPRAPAANDVLEGCADRHATVGWFGYSPALRKWGGKWTEARLKKYLHDPVGTVPGTIKTLSPVRDSARLDEIVKALGKL